VLASPGWEKVPAEQGDEGLMVTVRPSSDCSAITFSLREKEAWFPYSLLATRYSLFAIRSLRYSLLAIRYSLTSLHTE
jgi:hypothetical protein